MKKLILILAVMLTLPLAFFGCGEEEQTPITTLTDGFHEFYTERTVVCWQDAVAVYATGAKIADYDYSNALKASETLSDRAGWLITSALLRRQGEAVSSSLFAQYESEISAALTNDFADLTVKETALCFYALTAAGAEFSPEEAVKELEKRQKNDGGFARSEDYSNTDSESTSYALSVFMFARDSVNDNSFDKAVLYLSGRINEDNTVNDADGKKSASATALTLTALIDAGVTPAGEVATALTTAIKKDFLYQSGAVPVGYKRYAEDTDVNREVTGEVFMCYSAAVYGSFWEKLAEEKPESAA